MSYTFETPSTFHRRTYLEHPLENDLFPLLSLKYEYQQLSNDRFFWKDNKRAQKDELYLPTMLSSIPPGRSSLPSSSYSASYSSSLSSSSSTSYPQSLKVTNENDTIIRGTHSISENAQNVTPMIGSSPLPCNFQESLPPLCKDDDDSITPDIIKSSSKSLLDPLELSVFNWWIDELGCLSDVIENREDELMTSSTHFSPIVPNEEEQNTVILKEMAYLKNFFSKSTSSYNSLPTPLEKQLSHPHHVIIHENEISHKEDKKIYERDVSLKIANNINTLPTVSMNTDNNSASTSTTTTTTASTTIADSTISYCDNDFLVQKKKTESSMLMPRIGRNTDISSHSDPDRDDVSPLLIHKNDIPLPSSLSPSLNDLDQHFSHRHRHYLNENIYDLSHQLQEHSPLYYLNYLFNYPFSLSNEAENLMMFGNEMKRQLPANNVNSDVDAAESMKYKPKSLSLLCSSANGESLIKREDELDGVKFNKSILAPKRSLVKNEKKSSTILINNQRRKMTASEKRDRHLESEKRRRLDYRNSFASLHALLPCLAVPDRNQGEFIYRACKFVQNLKAEIADLRELLKSKKETAKKRMTAEEELKPTTATIFTENIAELASTALSTDLEK